jgi:hypothetical protein
VLARRGIALAPKLRSAGFLVLECYPFATLRLLGLPAQGKRTHAGRLAIAGALAALVPGLDHPDATEHELDGVVCALTADLWLRGQCRLVGDPAEGQMVVPWPAYTGLASYPARRKRAAETSTSYETSGNDPLAAPLRKRAAPRKRRMPSGIASNPKPPSDPNEPGSSPYSPLPRKGEGEGGGSQGS